MATNSRNTSGLPDATALPPALRNLDLAEVGCDARHLSQLIGTALDNVVVLRATHPDQRQELERATALLWVARDLADVLDWKLDRMDTTFRLEHHR